MSRPAKRPRATGRRRVRRPWRTSPHPPPAVGCGRGVRCPGPAPAGEARRRPVRRMPRCCSEGLQQRPRESIPARRRSSTATARSWPSRCPTPSSNKVLLGHAGISDDAMLHGVRKPAWPRCSMSDPFPVVDALVEADADAPLGHTVALADVDGPARPPARSPNRTWTASCCSNPTSERVASPASRVIAASAGRPQPRRRVRGQVRRRPQGSSRRAGRRTGCAGRDDHRW